MDYTSLTMKIKTTRLTIPTDMWRTSEAALPKKVNCSVLSFPTYFQTIERIQKKSSASAGEQKLSSRTTKDNKDCCRTHVANITTVVWLGGHMFFKYADTSSKKSEASDLPNFLELILHPIQENDNDENQSSHQNLPLLELQMISNGSFIV